VATYAAAADPDRRALYDCEYRTIGTQDGIIRWVAAKGRGVFDDNGRCTRVTGTAIDISHRKAMELQLRELNENLEVRVAAALSERQVFASAIENSPAPTMICNLGHQIVAINSACVESFRRAFGLIPAVGINLLELVDHLPRHRARVIAGAAQSAERAKTLVQRLLAFARRQPLQPVPVDIPKLVRGMGELVASTTGPNIVVTVEATNDLPPAKADPNQLEMALLNLAVNARDAMPDGGTLTISAAAVTMQANGIGQLAAGQYICLSVADTGIGMDAETAARAIEPFFSTKGIGRGTGLGLSMVHGLASQLGGELVVRSEAGIGTTMELWLPQSEVLRPFSEGGPSSVLSKRMRAPT